MNGGVDEEQCRGTVLTTYPCIQISYTSEQEKIITSSLDSSWIEIGRAQTLKVPFPAAGPSKGPKAARENGGHTACAAIKRSMRAKLRRCPLFLLHMQNWSTS